MLSRNAKPASGAGGGQVQWLVGGSVGAAALERLDRELLLERERIDKQRADDRKADADRLERIETDIRAMRDVMFEAFQRGRTD